MAGRERNGSDIGMTSPAMAGMLSAQNMADNDTLFDDLKSRSDDHSASMQKTRHTRSLMQGRDDGKGPSQSP